MVYLVLKVVLAHILGDFVFQTSAMVKEIETKKIQSKYLYIHGFIHFLLLLFVTKFETKFLLPIIILSTLHLIIDIFTKIFLKKKTCSLTILFIDQLLHSLTLAIFINYFYPFSINFELILSSKNHLLLLAIICNTFVASIIIKKIMEVFNYELPNNGIKDAGKYIGMLERLFIFGFIISSFWEGVGFLLAAKSIFRFGDLTEKKEIKLTEYILIGTLISFGLAFIIAKIYLKLNKLV